MKQCRFQTDDSFRQQGRQDLFIGQIKIICALVIPMLDPQQSPFLAQRRHFLRRNAMRIEICCARDTIAFLKKGIQHHLCAHVLTFLLFKFNYIVPYCDRSSIFSGHTLLFIVSRKYQDKNDRFETHCVLNRSFQLFPINYHDNALNSLHTVERIQNARNSLVILFYTTISSKRFSAIEFSAFKNIFSLGIFKALYINSRPFKSYFIRYYFSYNHIKALSIISSYISKTGVNVVYIHFIHRSIP